jgi:transcriptional regulator with XRE-family HTH domain
VRRPPPTLSQIQRDALADAILEIRGQLKQEGLANAAGLSRNYLSQIETGRGNPLFAAILDIAGVCNMGLEEVGRIYDRCLRARKARGVARPIPAIPGR